MLTICEHITEYLIIGLHFEQTKGIASNIGIEEYVSWLL